MRWRWLGAALVPILTSFLRPSQAALDAMTADRDNLMIRLKDADLRLAQQGAIIATFRAWAQMQDEPNPRPCFCGPTRWRAWRDGVAAGPDGVVGSSDDDLTPNYER